MWFDIGTSSSSDLFRAVTSRIFEDVKMIGVEPMAKDYAECAAWVRQHNLTNRVKMLRGACAPGAQSTVTFFVHRNNHRCSSLLPDSGTSSLAAACCPHKNITHCVALTPTPVQVPAFSLEALLTEHAPPPTRVELVKARVPKIDCDHCCRCLCC